MKIFASENAVSGLTDDQFTNEIFAVEARRAWELYQSADWPLDPPHQIVKIAGVLPDISVYQQALAYADVQLARLGR